MCARSARKNYLVHIIYVAGYFFIRNMFNIIVAELFGIQSKMRLESKSRRSNASGQVRGVRVTGCVVAHR